MADFNIKLPDAPASGGLVNASRGGSAIEPRKAVALSSSRADTSASKQNTANMIKGVGDLITGATKATDDLITSYGSDVLHNKLDMLYKEMGVDDIALGQAPATNEDVPSELEAAAKNIARLDAAKRAGTLSQTAYAGRVESIARQMRAQFPGHRDYFDNKVAQITGMRPANEIINNMFEAANRANSQALSAEKDRINYIEKLSSSGLWNPAMLNMSHEQLISYAGPLLARKESLDQSRKDLEYRKALREDVTYQSGEQAQKDVNFIAGTFLKNTFSTFGTEYKQVNAALKAKMDSGEQFSAEEIKAITDGWNMSKLQLLTKAEETTRKYNLDKNGTDRAMQSVNMIVSNMDAAIKDKDIGAMYRLNNYLKFYEDGNDLKLLRNPSLAIASSMNRKLGQYGSQVFFDTDERLKDSRVRGIIADDLYAQFSDPNYSLHDSYKHLGSVGAATPDALKANLQANLQLLSSEGVSDLGKKEGLQRLFGPRSKGFIADISSDKTSVYSSMVNPMVAGVVKSVAKVYPEVEQWYRDWAAEGFAVAYGPIMNDLAANIQAGTKIQLTPDNKLTVVSVSAAGNASAYNTNINTAKNLVNKINVGLAGYNDVADSVGVSTEQLLQSFGVLPRPPAGVGLKNGPRQPNQTDATVPRILPGQSDQYGWKQITPKEGTQAELNDLLERRAELLKNFSYLPYENINSDPNSIDQFEKAIVQYTQVNDQIRELKAILAAPEPVLATKLKGSKK